MDFILSSPQDSVLEKPLFPMCKIHLGMLFLNFVQQVAVSPLSPGLACRFLMQFASADGSLHNAWTQMYNYAQFGD